MTPGNMGPFLRLLDESAQRPAPCLNCEPQSHEVRSVVQDGDILPPYQITDPHAPRGRTRNQRRRRARRSATPRRLNRLDQNDIVDGSAYRQFEGQTPNSPPDYAEIEFDGWANQAPHEYHRTSTLAQTFEDYVEDFIGQGAPQHLVAGLHIQSFIAQPSLVGAMNQHPQAQQGSWSLQYFLETGTENDHFTAVEHLGIGEFPGHDAYEPGVLSISYYSDSVAATHRSRD